MKGTQQTSLSNLHSKLTALPRPGSGKRPGNGGWAPRPDRDGSGAALRLLLLAGVALISLVLASAAVPAPAGPDGSSEEPFTGVPQLSRASSEGHLDLEFGAGEKAKKTVPAGDTASFELTATSSAAQSGTYNLTWTGLGKKWDLDIEGAVLQDEDGYNIHLKPLVGEPIVVVIDTPSTDKTKVTTEATVNLTLSTADGDTWASQVLEVRSKYDPRFYFDVSFDAKEDPEQGLLPDTPAVVMVVLVNNGNIDDVYDLTISFGSNARSGGEGEGARSNGWYAEFLENHDDQLALPISAGTEENSDRADFNLFPPEVAPEGGGSISVTMTVNSRAGAQTQTRSFTARVLDQDSVILLETDEADLLMMPGETRSLLVTATNQGFKTLTYYPPLVADIMEQLEGEGAGTAGEGGGPGWTAGIQFGTGADPLTGEALLEIDNAYDSAMYKLTLTVPENAIGNGVHTLSFQGEASEGGYVRPLQVMITVGLVHNITITPEASELSLKPGEVLDIGVEVANGGNGKDSVTLGLGGDVESVPADLSDTLVTLSPRDSQKVSLSLAVPDDAALGPHQLIIEARYIGDGSSQPIENITIALEVKDYPDPAFPDDAGVLTIMPRILAPGEKGTLNATVHNLGRLDAKNVVVLFQYETAKGSLIDIGEPVTLALVPGLGYANASVQWVPPQHAIAARTLHVTIDPPSDGLPGGAIAELDEDNNAARTTLTVSGDYSSARGGDESRAGTFVLTGGELGAIMVVMFLGALVVALAAKALGSEAGRYGAFMAFAPLYSKLKPDRILDNDIRSQVYDYVKANPGDHFRSIMSNLNLTNGTLAYHLATLEREEMIKSERDGGYKRFYPMGRQFAGEVVEINGLQKQILDVIARNPGISQKKIALVLGTSTPTVSYHIKALKAARLIDVRREGKMTRCFISQPAA